MLPNVVSIQAREGKRKGGEGNGGLINNLGEEVARYFTISQLCATVRGE